MTQHTRSRPLHRRPRRAVALGSVLTLGVLAGCGSGQASESDTWTLRTNDWNPPSHPFNVSGWEVFGKEVEERTGGRVRIEHYPSEGLGAVTDSLTMMQTGEADMASTTVAYNR